MITQFRDRAEAGRLLAKKLSAYANRPDVLVLGLPRGGVPVAFEVAEGLGAPLDIVTVRKLGVPGYEELAMGAIATGGVCVLNSQLVRDLGIPEGAIASVTKTELQELERREQAYRGDRPAIRVQGRTVIVVDDGLATGATMRAAVVALERQQPKRIVLAVPVAALETYEDFKAEVDKVVAVLTPSLFFAVGFWYKSFSHTTDEEVRDLLDRAADRQSAAARRGTRSGHAA